MSWRTSSYRSSIDRAIFLPWCRVRKDPPSSYEGFDQLNHVVLTNEQFLQFLPVAPAGLLEPVDLVLNRRTLALPPETLENADAVVSIVHVRFAFARDGGHELGIHHC